MIGHSETLKTLSRAGICVLALLCGVAAAGWLLGISVLTSIVPGWPRMAMTVLICHLICGMGVLELTLPAHALALVRKAGAVFVMAVAIYFLIDFAVGGEWSSGNTTGLFSPRMLGHPSPVSAFDFLLAAIALMMPLDRTGGRLYSGLIAAGLAVTGFNFAGYAYDIAALSRGPTVSAMSLPTMISFILLFASALMARPQDGWTAVILARNSGGVVARRLFPALLILPFITNGIVVLVYRARPFDAPFGFAVLTVMTSIGLCIVTVLFAGWLGRHENERRRSEELLEAIIDNSMAVIYVKDLAGRYIMVNRRYLDVFHLERHAVIGKTDYDIFSKYEADSYRKMDEEVVRAGKAMTGEEIASQADGFHTYLSLKAPLMDAQGRPYAVFGISTDITDHKRASLASVKS
jgi:PAS domain S-box-containing protein